MHTSKNSLDKFVADFSPFFPQCEKEILYINKYNKLRDWSISTGGEGGLGGPEHFEMWWLENT